MYQAFGRTALEAMACGATAVRPGRAAAPASSPSTASTRWMVDTLDESAVVSACVDVLSDADRARSMQAAAVETASRFSAERAALSEYLLFQREHARLAPDRAGTAA